MAQTQAAAGGSEGLVVLTPDVEKPFVDIVFVHGLNGNRFTTWTKASIMWPRDILSKDEGMEKARISTWGYNSDIVRFWTQTPEQDIDCYSRDLCSDLSAKRKETNTEEVPIIFVMHSLGGLVCEEALLLGRVHPDEPVKMIGEHTRGMVFLGTPHGGSDLASWANIGLSFAKLFKRLNNRNVKLLMKDSEKLAKIGEAFPLVLADRANAPETKIMVACFYETLPMDHVGIIVEEKSATLAGYRKSSIPQDHSEMCKFTHAEDVGYTRVRGILRQIIEKLKPSTEKKPEARQVTGYVYAESVYGVAAGVNEAQILQRDFTFNIGPKPPTTQPAPRAEEDPVDKW
ncbi:hypothetical protein BDV19DRAFT_364614 [Aspergillus venezuelensis]